MERGLLFAQSKGGIVLVTPVALVVLERPSRPDSARIWPSS